MAASSPPSFLAAREHTSLKVQVRTASPLVYDNDSDPQIDRPPFVRAASSLVYLVDRLAVVQDDANFLALIDPNDHQAESITLPAGPEGHRVHDYDKGTGEHKLDLEACAAVPGTGGELLLAFGSGSSSTREWVVIVDWRDREDPETQLHEAPDLYAAWRKNKQFCGSGLNIEGAIFVDDDTLRLFQRGNASPRDGLEPVDATADVHFPELLAHLDDPFAPVPSLGRIVQYDLGMLDGVRLTFSDAEELPGGRVLFSASAEGEDRIAGSVLGIIDDEGARWTRISDEDGSIFRGKVEGLSVLPNVPGRAYFVIDDDDSERPSDLYEVALEGGWGL